ncbi:MAG: hypothetical protein KJN87_00615, partial [Desulfofustis sp.]|nr:hypothetical protein [Desulfofustis sp.]
QSSSLKGFTSRMGLDLNRSMELLRDAGIEVTDDKEMVQDIAERSGNTPQQIYDIIKPAGISPAAPGADTHSEDGADKAMNPPKSGMGKKTITQLCEEIGQDCDMIIAGLKQRGMTIDPEQKLKDLAAENGTGPMQIYEAMVEIVNENKGQ